MLLQLVVAALLLGQAPTCWAGRPFSEALSEALLGDRVHAAAEAIALALRMQASQRAAVAGALSTAFERGGAEQATASLSMAELLSSDRRRASVAAEAAFTQALLDVMAHNTSAAAAAVAGGLTSGDAALEQGTLRALRLMGRHAGCACLAALLRDAHTDASALGSPGFTADFERHAQASQAECEAVGHALRRAAGAS